MNQLHSESNSALEKIRQAGQSKKKIVFVSGNFILLHPGHLRLLKFAADCGDLLVVGVNAQSEQDAIISEDLRLEAIMAISFVTFAFVLYDTPQKFIQELKPAIVVKGKEHEDHLNPEQEVVESYGGKLLFSSGEVRFSSLDLLKRSFRETNFSTISLPMDYPKRHGFRLADLTNIVRKFSNLKVAVIGDLIVDEYIHCEALGMSREDPTVVVTPIQQEKFIGGAGIVAAHARGLGAKVSFFSVIGKDVTSQFAYQKLESFGIQYQIFEDESRPTTLKTRYRADGKTMLRVSHLKQHPISSELVKKLVKAVTESIEGCDLVIFSDFNYGCLPQAAVNSIIEYCRFHEIPMVADSQSSSQVGDISRYKGMNLLTPTEYEARLALRDFNSGLVILAEKLRKKTDAKNVILTLGSEGLLVNSGSLKKGEFITDRIPAMNTAPKDVSGAGDSFLVCSSLALTMGSDLWQSAYLGALAAACQVGRVGNVPLSPADIESELRLSPRMSMDL